MGGTEGEQPGFVLEQHRKHARQRPMIMEMGLEARQIKACEAQQAEKRLFVGGKEGYGMKGYGFGRFKARGCRGSSVAPRHLRCFNCVMMMRHAIANISLGYLR